MKLLLMPGIAGAPARILVSNLLRDEAVLRTRASAFPK